MDPAEPTAKPAERTGIVVVVIITAIRAGLIALALLLDGGAVAADWLAERSPIPIYPAGTTVGVITRGLLVAMLIVSLLCVWGVWRRHEWGWTLSIVTAGAILALNLGWWASGDPHYVSMAVNSILIFYLNQRDLRVVFKVGRQ